MVSIGNASGAGLPAAKEITPGILVNFKISRIAEGCNASTFSANLYCMGTFFLSDSVLTGYSIRQLHRIFRAALHKVCAGAVFRAFVQALHTASGGITTLL